MLEVINKFFPLKICLNHPTATERWGFCLQEFKRVGLKGVTRFEALPSIGPHQSFNRSVRNILQFALRSPYDRVLFLEDDVTFVKTDHVERAINELPDNWDVLYFGANILHTEPKPTPYSSHLCRIHSGWTTHALAFNKKCISFILENIPGESEQMFDTWLSGNLSRLNSYIVTPMAAYQRPGTSLIWGTTTNYDQVFTSSDIILNHICKHT
jgi:hypothetical protein